MVKIAKIAAAVFFLAFLLALVPHAAQASTIEVRPAGGSFEVGDLVTVQIVVSGTVPVNAASVEVKFPTSIFSIESISKGSSILNFWVTEPSFSKSSGIVKFEGVALGGFSGTQGNLITVKLRAVKAGAATVSFQSGEVFANDGEGTNITSGLVGGTFSIAPGAAIIVKPVVKETGSAGREEEFTLEVPQPQPSLKAPEIVLGAKYGEPAIIGSSDYPDAEVLVTFVAKDGAKIFITSTADADGGFMLLIPSSLKRGEYTVTAVMIEKDKTNSMTSNQITIPVGSILSDIGIEELSLVALLLVLVLLFAWKAYHKSRHALSPLLGKEVKEAEAAVRKSFDALREDIDTLGGKITAHSKLKKDIDSAERSISRELDDIK